MTGPIKTSEPPRIRLVFQLERAELLVSMTSSHGSTRA